jgi:hypothetical protein
MMKTTEKLDFANDELVLDLGALQAIHEMGGEDGDFVLNNITALCVFKTYNNSSEQNNCGDEQTRPNI